MTGILISMLSCAVVTAVSEEICGAIGRLEYAKWIKAGGISLTAGLGLGCVIKLIGQTRKAFGG